MLSLNQLAANRANAQLSTGPTSSEGKAKVSHNAVKTGLTGRTVLLPTDDVAAYQAQVERIFQQFSPEADEEKRLTQSLADTLWRLDRIPLARSRHLRDRPPRARRPICGRRGRIRPQSHDRSPDLSVLPPRPE